MKLVLAQLNPIVGNIRHNLNSLIDCANAHSDADLLITPELFLSGYLLDDFVLSPILMETITNAIDTLCQANIKPAMLVGTPWFHNHKLVNAALLIKDNHIAALCIKSELPHHGVFDETRIFTTDVTHNNMFALHGVKIGVLICEDLWHKGPVKKLVDLGAELLISLNASPFAQNKPSIRQVIAAKVTLPLIYLNQVGGQDELVFDGGSFLMAPQQPNIYLPNFETCVWDVDYQNQRFHCNAVAPAPSQGVEAVYRALVLGIRDYVHKNKASSVILGLSGGIDSALCTLLCVEALGSAKVKTYMITSPYTSQVSIEEAHILAQNLGVTHETLELGPLMQAVDTSLAPLFAGYEKDVTEENLQSRLRGLLLMALSNKTGSLLIATGNKSEMAMGYATLYGDMCGAYAPLKDVYKTLVYDLCLWRNLTYPDDGLAPKIRHLIPERTLSRAPSAELRENQTDQDSLPPYDVLDAILQGLIEDNQSIKGITKQGYPEDLVVNVHKTLLATEYKRRQAPPGPKITHKAFGRDRRYPITNRFYN